MQLICYAIVYANAVVEFFSKWISEEYFRLHTWWLYSVYTTNILIWKKFTCPWDIRFMWTFTYLHYLLLNRCPLTKVKTWASSCAILFKVNLAPSAKGMFFVFVEKDYIYLTIFGIIMWGKSVLELFWRYH